MNKYINNIAFALSIALTIVIAYQYFNGYNKKIAVVKFHELIKEYKGMKDATQAYTLKMNKWSAQSDSMKATLESLIQEIKLDSVKGDKKKLESDYRVFLYKRQTYFQYKEKIEKIAQEEDKIMTEGVIHQIKQHIQNFAAEHHYDFIITDTQENSLNFITEGSDITPEIIKFANEKYEGEN